MNFLDFTNDAAQTSPYAFPPGRYVMEVVSAEIKDNKAGTGQFAKLKFKITGGEHKGKSVYHQFNIKHANEKAQSIARSEFKTMLQAMGMNPTLSSITDVIGRSCMVRVGTEKGFDGNDRPAVKGFDVMSGASESQAPLGF